MCTRLLVSLPVLLVLCCLRILLLMLMLIVVPSLRTRLLLLLVWSCLGRRLLVLLILSWLIICLLIMLILSWLRSCLLVLLILGCLRLRLRVFLAIVIPLTLAQILLKRLLLFASVSFHCPDCCLPALLAPHCTFHHNLRVHHSRALRTRASLAEDPESIGERLFLIALADLHHDEIIAYFHCRAGMQLRAKVVKSFPVEDHHIEALNHQRLSTVVYHCRDELTYEECTFRARLFPCLCRRGEGVNHCKVGDGENLLYLWIVSLEDCQVELLVGPYRHVVRAVVKSSVLLRRVCLQGLAVII